MAKSNIKTLARILAGRYEQANGLLTDLGLSIENTMLSPEEQQELSKKKAAVDVELGNLSVVLSAAAQGKLDEIREELSKQDKMYLEQQALLLNDLASADIEMSVKEQTEKLIASFNQQRAILDEQRGTVTKIGLVLNLPRNKRKQRKLLRDFAQAHITVETGHAPTNLLSMSLASLELFFYDKLGIFKKVDDKLNLYSEYVTTINDVETSTAGDLDE